FIWGDHSTKLNVPIERVTISKVEFGPFQEWTTATGQFVPKVTHMLTAVEGGRVQEIHVEPGDHVVKGQILLVLENTQLQLSIMGLEAQVSASDNEKRRLENQMLQNNLRMQQGLVQTQQSLVQLRREYERQKALMEKNATSEQLYLDAKDRYEYAVKFSDLAIQQYKQDSTASKLSLVALEATSERLTNNLRFSQQQVDNLKIKAPITGQLTSFNAEIGETKPRGVQFGVIDDLEGGYKAEVSVDEFYLPRVKRGQYATFPLAGQEWRAVIKRVIPEVLNGSFIVEMDFVGDIPQNIRTGQTIHTKLQLGELTEALLLPRGGFYSKTGGNWVFVVDPSTSQAIKRRIKINRQNNNYFEVTEGLQPGELVITSTYDNYGEVDKLILTGDSEILQTGGNN
ncbi:efflux RND transporter periplasmic adaptor subunit, partial [candidate division KSB1 bacterium]